MRNLLRNLLKMLTGVLTPLGMAVACLVVAVAATIECPRILPFAIFAVVLLTICLAKKGGK